MTNNEMAMNDEALRFMQEDAEIEQIMKAQQDHLRAQERDKLDIEVKCEAAKYNAFQKRVRHTFHNVDRMCMFLAGVSASTAVHFFDDSTAVGMAASILCSFGWVSIANYCDRKSRKRKGGV